MSLAKFSKEAFPVCSFALVNLRKVRIAPFESQPHNEKKKRNTLKVRIIFLVNSGSFEPYSCSEVRPSSVRSANLNTFKLLFKINDFRCNHSQACFQILFSVVTLDSFRFRSSKVSSLGGCERPGGM